VSVAIWPYVRGGYEFRTVSPALMTVGVEGFVDLDAWWFIGDVLPSSHSCTSVIEGTVLCVFICDRRGNHDYENSVIQALIEVAPGQPYRKLPHPIARVF